MLDAEGSRAPAAAVSPRLVAEPGAVIPVPRQVEVREPAAAFVVGAGVRLVADPSPAAVSTAVLVAARVGRVTGVPVAVLQEDDGGPGAIVLRLGTAEDVGAPADLAPALLRDAYRLDVTAERAVITATAGPGLLAGAFTLQHSAVAGEQPGTYEVAPQLVVDHPEYAWRGLCVDVARHFFGVADLRAVVEVMASFKMNVLHLHLTDDQGWRLAVPSRPTLTEVSGRTAVSGDPGGWLTDQDYAELVDYAASRWVTVVPEVDLPGHVNAALHALGELTPSGERALPYTGVDVGFSRLHLDLPATRPFLHDVLGDVAAMTPGQWVHIGGDEVLTVEAAEYTALVRAAMAEVAGAGKVVVGWQEAATALDPAERADGVVLQYWDEREDTQALTMAALRGASVVLSPATKVYLDMRYDDATPVGTDWAGRIEVRDAYDWEPRDLLPGVPPDRLLGVEAALWTETVRTRDDLFLLLLPRLAAVAEVAWSAPARRGWDSFAARLPAHTARWDEAGMTWYRSPQVDW